MKYRYLSLFTTILSCSALALFIGALFFIPDHDWDIDAFLYLGSRLWHGELLYFYDFETKLPFLQYIFALASCFGGVGAWRIITFILTFSFGLISSYLLVNAFITSGTAAYAAKSQIMLLCFSLFMAVLYSLPGSESAHIEMIAASAAYLSFALLISSIRINFKQVSLMLAGAGLAIASLIRPNYIYLIPFIMLWLILRKNRSNRMFLRELFFDSAAFVLGFTTIAILSFLPYFFVDGGLNALRDGLIAIATWPKQFDLKYGLIKLLQIQLSHSRLFVFSLYATLIPLFLFSYYCNFKKSMPVINDSLLLAAFAIIALNLSLWRTHYYPHNLIMFVPYIIPLFMVVVFSLVDNAVFITCGRFRKSYYAALMTILLLMIAAPVMKAAILTKNILIARHSFSGDINNRRIDYTLLTFLNNQKNLNKSFLVVDSPIYHMLLEESRIGDGHPAMLGRVFAGTKLGPISDIGLYGKRVHANPCYAIYESNKDLIILNRNSSYMESVGKCMENQNDIYIKILPPDLDKYYVYARN